MKTDKHVLVRALALAVAVACSSSAQAQVLYTNGFDKAEVEKVPEDMMVLDGGFAVKEEGGNKFLELPGAPLETFGVLFGPAEGVGTFGLCARAELQQGPTLADFCGRAERGWRLQAGGCAGEEIDRVDQR